MSVFSADEGMPKETITVDKRSFQALHAAARSLYAQALSIEDHSVASLQYLLVLNDAINAGHELLGTNRADADRFITTVQQAVNQQKVIAQQILEREGLWPVNED